MKTQNSKGTGSSKNRKRSKIILVLLLIILAAIIGGLIYFFAMSGSMPANASGSGSTASAQTPTLSDNGQSLQGENGGKTDQDTLEKLKEQQVYVTDSIASCITFESGNTGSTGAWNVENLKSNNVIEQVEVYLSDNDSLICKTTPIFPNQHIESINLLQDLDKGNHEALAYINYYNTETKAYLGKTAYKINVQVG